MFINELVDDVAHVARNCKLTSRDTCILTSWAFIISGLAGLEKYVFDFGD